MKPDFHLPQKPQADEIIPLRMRVSIKRLPDAPFGFRIYRATVETGPEKGRTFESKVLDCGQGAAAFDRRLKAVWPKAYVA